MARARVWTALRDSVRTEIELGDRNVILALDTFVFSSPAASGLIFIS